jgi:hypothetical protein
MLLIFIYGMIDLSNTYINNPHDIINKSIDQYYYEIITNIATKLQHTFENGFRNLSNQKNVTYEIRRLSPFSN